MSSFLLSKLVFGTGGRFGRFTEPEAFELVRFAYVHGIAVFDTGLDYCNGRSQPLLYKSLLQIGVARKSFSVCTKVSINALVTHSKTDILLKIFSGYQRDLFYLDTLMLWGPSLSQLCNSKAFDILRELQADGFVRRVGINTHDSQVMDHVIDDPDLSFVQDIMVDFNILQKSRSDLIDRFSQSQPLRRAWAGTALCQGFLLQSLFSMYIRTRSISYVARALLSPPTRIYLKKASPARRLLRKYFGEKWREIPLSFVLNHYSVSYVPMGMLSKASIIRNVDIATSPVDNALINSFMQLLPEKYLVDDVFT